jgi:hypothetical protein
MLLIMLQSLQKGLQGDWLQHFFFKQEAVVKLIQDA